MNPSRKLQCCLLLIIGAVVLRGGSLGAAPYDDCEVVCGPSVECDTNCTSYGDIGFDTTCGEYGGGSTYGRCIGYCGDGYCNHSASEDQPSDPDFCLVDCGVCGDGICYGGGGESCSNCAEDCGSCPPGGCCVGVPGLECGDGHHFNSSGVCCALATAEINDSSCWGLCNWQERCLPLEDGMYACIGNGSDCGISR